MVEKTFAPSAQDGAHKMRSLATGRRMKVAWLLGLILLCLPAFAGTVPTDLSGVRGFNYTPVSASWPLSFWLRYDPQEIDRDLGYAQGIMLNQVRTFVPYEAWETDPKIFAASLDSFMAATEKHGMGVMLVLWMPRKLVDGLSGQAQADADAKLQTWVRALASMVKDKPSMAFWDVANEPDWDGYPEARMSQQQIDRRMQLARMFADTVHAADPGHPTTVGCFKEKCMEELASYTDVLSFHDYSPTLAEIDDNIDKAKAFAAKVHKPVLNTEMGCIGRANPYDVMLHEYKKANVGFYIWELMITQFWGDVHGVFYADGSVRDPAIAAAVMGIFRSHGPSVVLEAPDREGWVTSSVADGKKWLATPNPDWKEGLKIAEIQANLLEAGQLVAMRNLPTRTVDLLRAGPPDLPALRAAIAQYVELLQPYVDPHPRNTH